VLARLSTSDPARDVSDLCALGAQTIDTTENYVRAARLATRLSQHLFDTLYHAAALDVPGCVLVTADTRYLAKARRIGRITSLADRAE
jgi:hypothetical protein